jgi:hypothetical protein
MSASTAQDYRPREVVTDDMVARGLAVFNDYAAPHYPPDLLIRQVIEAALHDPNRCGNCGGTLANVRADATWCSAACKMAAHRQRKASRSRNRRHRRRPGGRQVSFRRGVRSIAAYLEDVELYSPERAARVAERELGKALPARQRHLRPRAAEFTADPRRNRSSP